MEEVRLGAKRESDLVKITERNMQKDNHPSRILRSQAMEATRDPQQ